MPIDRAIYQKLFPTEFQFLNIRLGGESSIGEGETWLGQMKELHQQATDFHKELYPQLYNGEIPSPPLATLPTLKVEREQIEGKSVAEQIATVTELKVLEGYKLLVKNNPDWLNAYNLKLKELTA
jgi:hypothetical protein